MTLNALAVEPVVDESHKYWRVEVHTLVNYSILEYGIL
jgi:hypothetical protein